VTVAIPPPRASASDRTALSGGAHSSPRRAGAVSAPLGEERERHARFDRADVTRLGEGLDAGGYADRASQVQTIEVLRSGRACDKLQSWK
jgi:hypothetical protein